MIAVVDYHKGNLKSVERGLEQAGLDARITDDRAAIVQADALVLPGVGSFTDAAQSMEALGQMDLLRERIQEGAPFLGICLGLHLLFEGGEEHASGAPTPGMALIPGIVGPMADTDEAGQSYKIPHVGWNSVEQRAPSPLFEGIADGEYFYFTHSYAVPESTATIATSTYATTFPCAVQWGDRAFAVQFHPEKSSDAGMRLLSNFARICKES